MNMEIIEKIYIEDRSTFKEAVKIINHLSPENHIQYKFLEVPQNDQVSVVITLEKSETLVLLIRLHEKLIMSYTVNDIFITLEDVLGYKPQRAISGFRTKFLRLLISLLIIIAILMTLIITQVGKVQQVSFPERKYQMDRTEYKP